MKTKTGNRILKILCIAAVFVLMLILSGCRTRITNNNEVNNVMYDDGGYMQEEYDMRREDLDLSTAKKPVFTGFGNPEEEEDEDYDFGEDGQALEDYEPDEFEDEVDDSNPPLPNSSTTTTPGTGTVKRRVITNNAPVVITVTLNPNGGKCKTKTLAVRKDGKYGILPTPTRDDYTFTGWYTKKEDGKGKKVTSTTKVASTTNHTLYAHWKKGEEKKEEDKTSTDPTPTPTPTPQPETPEEEVLYTVVYTDGADGSVFSDKTTNNLKKDDNTPDFGPEPSRNGYTFLGWNPTPTEKIDTGSADSNHVIRYKAQWESFNDIWSDTFKETKKTQKKVSFIGPDSDNDVVKSCNGDKGTDNPKKIGVVVTNDLDGAEAVSGADKTIVVSKDAVKSSDENKALYIKLLILATIYDLDVSDARDELDIDTSDDDLIRQLDAVEAPPEEPPEEPSPEG